jgi:dual specificity phosphatase 12
MCRRHLAIREHMMDHILDQLPPAAAPAPASRPRTPSNFTLPAPLSAMTDNDAADEVIEDEDGGPSSAAAAATGSAARSRRPSVVSDVINPLTGLPGARSRRPSVPGNATPPQGRSRARSVLGEDLTMSRQASTPGIAAGAPAPSASAPAPVTGPGGRPILDADALAACLPPQLAALRAGLNPANNVVSASPAASSPADSPPTSPDQGPRRRMSSSLGGLGMTPATPAVSAPASAYPPNHPLAGLAAMGMPGMPGLTGLTSAGGPPILVNPKCSGYFVEPLTWMEPVLAGGAVSGKLVCPNEKCGAKIGNFDWAGVQCGCKDWVTPGFCLARSKVEEVW